MDLFCCMTARTLGRRLYLLGLFHVPSVDIANTVWLMPEQNE
jgi:hypothetical protein